MAHLGEDEGHVKEACVGADLVGGDLAGGEVEVLDDLGEDNGRPVVDARADTSIKVLAQFRLRWDEQVLTCSMQLT